jgi:hypothetical protein
MASISKKPIKKGKYLRTPEIKERNRQGAIRKWAEFKFAHKIIKQKGR